MKDKIGILVAVLIGTAVAGAFIIHDLSQRIAPQASSATTQPATPQAAPPSAAIGFPNPTVPAAALPPVVSAAPNNASAFARRAKVAPAPQPAKQQPQPQPLDGGPTRPLAREALAFVGADADAEAVWSDAINDASVPADERQNLIEDLNEDGLSDPDNPTRADLPLILNRIKLIEQMGPNAMDDVNAAAFKEAYKDLTDMAAKLQS